MSQSLCHIINPVKVNEKHDLFIAQPITFESLRRAKDNLGSAQQIEHLALGYPEDADLTPNFFTFKKLPDRSIRNILHSESLPKLPLLADILHTAYQNSQADYFIYSNVDIAVQPHFYAFVLEQINAGLDGFIINRRRIPAGHFSPADLPELYQIMGKSHPGFDCFVFHRDLFPLFSLGLVCIGIPFIEIITAQNLFCHARNFKLLDRAHLTFHIGEEVYRPRHRLLWLHNQQQFWRAIRSIWPLLDTRRFPWGHWPLPLRVIRWGLHPCIPIRLVLKLEWRQLWGVR